MARCSRCTPRRAPACCPRQAAPQRGLEDIELLDLRWAATAGYTLGSPGHFPLAVEEYCAPRSRTAIASTSRSRGRPKRHSRRHGSARFADCCLERAGRPRRCRRAPRVRGRSRRPLI
jgi:hypothetical protein